MGRGVLMSPVMPMSVSVLRNQGRKFSADTAHAKSVPLIVVVRGFHTATIEVHTVRVVRVVLSRRPIVAVRTGIVQRTGRVVAVPDSGKLEADVYIWSDGTMSPYVACYINER